MRSATAVAVPKLDQMASLSRGSSDCGIHLDGSVVRWGSTHGEGGDDCGSGGGTLYGQF